MVAALAATTITAAEANAAWTPTFPLSAPTGIAELPQVAVAPSGVATVVWTRYEGSEVAVHARRVDPDGARGPILDVSVGEEALNAQVAVDVAGNATVVWTGHEGSDAVARARRITSAGVLGDVLTLSAPGEIGFSPVVGVGGDGAAVVVWTRYERPDFRVQTRRIDAGGTLGPIDDVTPDSRANFDYDLAVDESGKAVVAWPWKAGADTIIQWRRLGGPIQDLTAAGSSAFDPEVAVDRAGVATAVWYRDDGTVQARRSAPGGALLPVVDLSTTESVDPFVAVDPSGDATVVWQRWDGVTDRIELRRYAADGTLGPVRDLWTGGDDIRPRLAVDGAGNATALWLHPGLRIRTAAPDGSLGPSLDLVDEEVQVPELATDAAGRTVAVWVRDDIVEGARFVIPPPPAPPAVPPSAAIVPTCPPVTVKSRRSLRPRGKRKGVGAMLVLDRDARLRLVSAKLRYGKGRTATLSIPRIGFGDEARLRFKLPRRLAAKLAVGRRVTLELKLRTAAAGCAFGATKTVRVRTSVRRLGER